jgi:uncharacterized protein YdhG (YjbR/CyaY superfamily)
VEAFREELAACKVDKGTIRFPLSAPIPKKLISEIAKFRLSEVTEHRKHRQRA